MKARITAVVVAAFAALGLGAGAASAAEAPTTVPDSASITTSIPETIDAAIKSIDLATDSTPEPTSPASDVLSFLQESITLAGRDILTSGTVYADEVPGEEGNTLPAVDNPDAPFRIPSKRLATDDEPSDDYHNIPVVNAFVSAMGDFIDKAAGTFEKIPGVGAAFTKLRQSEAWKSDYVRILGAAAVFWAAMAPITITVGLVLGVVTSGVLGVLTTMAVIALGGLFFLPFGALPAFIVGLLGVVLLVVFIIATPFWLVGGIIMIILGGIGLAAALAVAAGTAPTVAVPAAILGLGVPVLATIIAFGILAFLFGLAPWFPIGIALALILTAVGLFVAPILFGMAIMVIPGIILGVLVFVLSLFITIPLGVFLVAIVPAALFALYAYVKWQQEGPTRDENGKVLTQGERDKRREAAKAAAKAAERGETVAPATDSKALSFLSTRNLLTAAPKNPLNVIGDWMDWFWDSMQWYAGKLPFVGRTLQDGINAMRFSKLWKSDLFRIGVTVAFFGTVVLPLVASIGVIAIAVAVGVVAFVIADVILAIPLVVLGLLVGGILVFLGIILIPLLFLASVTAIIFGALLIAVAAGAAVGTLGTIVSGWLIGLAPGTAGFAIVAGLLGALLIVFGLLGLGISLIPFLWLFVTILFAVIAIILVALLFVIGLVIGAPFAAAIGVVVAVIAAVVLLPVVPVVTVPIGLAALAIGLIFGLTLPTRPKGEPQPKVTKEDDPRYMNDDERRANGLPTHKEDVDKRAQKDAEAQAKEDAEEKAAAKKYNDAVAAKRKENTDAEAKEAAEKDKKKNDILGKILPGKNKGDKQSAYGLAA